jgi:RNA polymerase sigma factor (TIGR02999 family)
LPTAEDVSRLLDELEQGREQAFDELFSLLYDELRALARGQRRKWAGRETLNTTALVHEAYLKLAAQPSTTWKSKAHFLAAAAKAIRHIMLNYARDQQALKRGGGWQRTSMDPAELRANGDAEGVIAKPEVLISLDDALRRLAGVSERLSRIVECRFFGGMSIEQTAGALNLSTATVTRGWATAQAWLYRELGPHTGSAGA